VKSLLESDLHSRIRNINIEVDTLVVGSTIESLVYSFLNNIPFVCSQFSHPRIFEYFNSQQDLSLFGLINTPHNRQTNLGSISQGINQHILWEKLFFHLSLAGLFPFPTRAISLRVSGNTLHASTANARMAKFHFNKLVIFDDKELVGVGAPQIIGNKYTVYDWFNVRSGMKHEYDQLEDTTDFVNRVVFYPSSRVDGNHNFKDAVAISYITQELLNSFECSDINARFKTLYMMKGVGIRGARNGRDMKNKARYKYYSVKIENTCREIVDPPKVYESSSNIIFNSDSFGDIINKNPLQDSYVSRIIK